MEPEVLHRSDASQNDHKSKGYLHVNKPRIWRCHPLPRIWWGSSLTRWWGCTPHPHFDVPFYSSYPHQPYLKYTVCFAPWLPIFPVQNRFSHIFPASEGSPFCTWTWKVCSLWPLNLDWDVQIFLHFRLALHFNVQMTGSVSKAGTILPPKFYLQDFATIWYLIRWLQFWPLALKANVATSWKFGHQVQNLVIRWRHLHWFQCCPPGWVTCIATLPGITLLALSVCIELVSSAARVRSVKFQ